MVARHRQVLVVWGVLSIGLAVRAFANGCLSQVVATGIPTVEPVRIDPNHAGVDELQALPGIGAGRAEAVVLERVRRGPFRSIDDLDRVDGVGPSTIEALRPFLVLSPRRGAIGGG